MESTLTWLLERLCNETEEKMVNIAKILGGNLVCQEYKSMERQTNRSKDSNRVEFKANFRIARSSDEEASAMSRTCNHRHSRAYKIKTSRTRMAQVECGCLSL